MPAHLAIDARGLTKRYGSRAAAVDGVDLGVRRGEIYGLLGPNGAGKTTTLKMLLGLVRPTSGTASVLGLPPGNPDGLSRTGSIVEAPAFYPFLSGRDNLRVVARRSAVTEARVGEALETVGLASRAKDRFGGYSLGMKQRLGVAAAILKDPELLILDEPSNGLDPPGQADMRGLVGALGGSGRAVVLSSHNLAEVERTCDRVGVIVGGKLVAEGTVEELRGGVSLLVRAEPLDRAAEVARGLAWVEEVAAEDGALRLAADPRRAPELTRALVEAGLRVGEVRPARRPLEDVFLELIGGQRAAIGRAGDPGEGPA